MPLARDQAGGDQALTRRVNNTERQLTPRRDLRGSESRESVRKDFSIHGGMSGSRRYGIRHILGRRRIRTQARGTIACPLREVRAVFAECDYAPRVARLAVTFLPAQETITQSVAC